MKIKENLRVLYEKVDDKCLEQFGFNIKDASFDKLVDYMYMPKDSSSLAITRILFGLAMLFDIPDERGGASMAKRWGDPKMCHFPLFPMLQPIPLPYMALVYAALWLGALGIMLGYKFTVTAPLFTICYWYLFLIEKSLWNNHTYLFGLVALLISCTQANCYWSVDVYLDPSKKKQTVPYWNYFVLKYQFFILYFMAGVKKGSAEWLTGYSVQNLSEHWVFDPFKFFLTVDQTDYLVVHWFVFVFDLTVAVWMMWANTRHVAMVFCALFHLMNSLLFTIGMFPWVCLATMPLFYPFDWPKKALTYFNTYYTKVHTYVHDKRKTNCKRKTSAAKDDINSEKENMESANENSEANDNSLFKSTTGTTAINQNVEKNDEFRKINEVFELIKDENGSDVKKIENNDQDSAVKDSHGDPKHNKKIIIYLIAFYALLQAFLPFSHFITKGYNNWTNGLYGYSWDMMVHTWDSSTVVIKVVDNDRNEEMYVEPTMYTLNDRWTRHGDMIYQYAQCLRNNIEVQNQEADCKDSFKVLSKNISIYVDIWVGLNGRFVQRMFDPKVDMLQATWSPFSKVPYLMPLIDEGIHWRKELDDIRHQVHSWTNNSDVVFYADFPGYEHEKYIPTDFKNVTLTVLDGSVVYEPEVDQKQIGRSYKLTTRNQIEINPGIFHKVINIGEKPAFYMYTFLNATASSTEANFENKSYKYKLPILGALHRRLHGMIIFGNLIISNIYQLLTFSHCN